MLSLRKQLLRLFLNHVKAVEMGFYSWAGTHQLGFVVFSGGNFREKSKGSLKGGTTEWIHCTALPDKTKETSRNNQFQKSEGKLYCTDQTSSMWVRGFVVWDEAYLLRKLYIGDPIENKLLYWRSNTKQGRTKSFIGDQQTHRTWAFIVRKSHDMFSPIRCIICKTLVV